jgi:hypothetical protein
MDRAGPSAGGRVIAAVKKLGDWAGIGLPIEGFGDRIGAQRHGGPVSTKENDTGRKSVPK